MAMGFVLCLIIGSSFGNYICGMFVAISFVPLICAYAVYSKPQDKAATYVAMIFACIYTVLILLVYFANVTSVRLDTLNQQAEQMLSTTQFGLFFNYDLLGYGVMSLAAFFVGLTIEVNTKSNKWLRSLLLAHGIFFISSFLIPLLGLFKTDMQGSKAIGPIIQSVWCLYFSIIDILSFGFFKQKQQICS
jgi:uncharacterized integral membrane protein